MAISPKKLKILIAEPDGYSPKAVLIYRKLGEVVTKKLKPKEFEKLLPQIDILVVRLGVPVNKELLNRAINLKVIATNTTGLNHVDLEECAKRKIKVISLRGHTSFLIKIHSTPELTWGLILALIRKIPWAFEHVRDGGWNRNEFAGHEICGKTLGIIGLGRIGKVMAEYGKVFGLNVVAVDPYVNNQEMKSLGVKKTSLENLFKNADIISFHVLHVPELNKIIKVEHFRIMKPSAVFINTARGELVDELGLLEALREKWIAGAALDVMDAEDPKGKHLNNNPLINYAKRHTNLLIVPHIGGATIEAWQATEEYLAGLVLEYLKNDFKR